MDQNIKNRLVGVIVVSSLAVIFLPMILDGSGVRKESLRVEIPPAPLVASNPDFESRLIELEENVAALPDLEARFLDEETAAEPEPEPVRRQAGESAPVEPPRQAAIVPEARSLDEAEPAARAGGDGYVLQVGSFRDRDKALTQRDQLRKSRIAAVFIEQFKLDSGSSYRVRLGPFLDRDQARVAQNKVKAKHDIDGIIMKYER